MGAAVQDPATETSEQKRRGARGLTLRARLVLLVVVCLVPLIAFRLDRRYADYQETVASSKQQTLELARGMALALAKELQGRIATLQVLALSRSLQEGNLERFRARAEAVAAEQFPGSNIVLLRQDGQQLLNTLLPRGAPLPLRQALETMQQVFASGRPAVSGLYQDQGAALGPRPMVAIDVPVKGADGHVIYALSSNPRLEAFADVIREQKLPEGWVAAIFDQNGTSLARNLSPERYVGRKGSDALLAHLLAEREGTVSAASREGIPLLTAFSHAEPFGWSVAIGVPLEQLTSPALYATARAMLAGGIVLAIGLVLALFVARQITVPMRLLHRLVADTSGEAVLDPPPTGLREADEVAEALRLAEVRRRRSEQEVGERTRSLESETEERRRVSEILEALAQQSALAIIALDPERRVTLWNPAAEKIFGYAADEVLGQPYPLVPPELQAAHLAIFQRFAAGALVQGGETVRRHKDGSLLPVIFSGTPLYDRERRFRGIVFMLEDATERRALEQQLRQAQKMEAIGQLTGGIAHDFNNMLAIVIGNAELLLEATSGDPRQTAMADAIMQSALRAADLTRRLLAFARKQPLNPEVIDLNQRLPEMVAMLRRTLGETVSVHEVFAAGLWAARADPAQVENALVNLAINARDAMPHGGSIAIETANAHLDQDYAALNAEVTPGDYVMLSVTDTGSGMSPEVIERAMEPFFTTKELGKGTGLGLSMIYGFAKQSGGHLKIYSELGHGTTVKLYLPRAVDDALSAKAVTSGESPRARGQEAILLVEDDAGVRELSTRILTELGYHVTAAEHGPAALAILKSGQPFDLIFTDAIMPEGMTGIQLAEAARRLRPGLKVLFTTGYARLQSSNGNAQADAEHLLRKPYRKKELAEKVREVLDGS